MQLRWYGITVGSGCLGTAKDPIRRGESEPGNLAQVLPSFHVLCRFVVLRRELWKHLRNFIKNWARLRRPDYYVLLFTLSSTFWKLVPGKEMLISLAMAFYGRSNWRNLFVSVFMNLALAYGGCQW